MARKSSAGLEVADKVIPLAIRDCGKAVEKEYARRWVLGHWREIVGDGIALHVEPMGIRGETLCLHSYEPVWQNEIRLRMPQIVQLVNNYAGTKLIKDLRFTRPWEHKEAYDVSAARVEFEEQRREEVSWVRERKKMPLAAEEIQKAEALGQQSDDEEFGALAAALYRKQLQMNKLKLKKGWQPCPVCGELTEPDGRGNVLCSRCRLEAAEAVRGRVRQVLRDIPWARMKEMRDYVPEATASIIAEQRAILVQQLAAEVDVNDRKSVKALQLVMLAQGVRPEQLTEDRVARTLYNLRFDMNRPKDYKAPRRYEAIKQGREGEKAKRTLAEGAEALLRKQEG